MRGRWLFSSACLSLEKRARPLAADVRRDVRLSLLRRRVDGNRSFRRVRVSPSARNRLLHSADRRSSLSRARETHPRLRRLDTLFTVRHRRCRFRLFHCTRESQDGIPEGRLNVFNNITCWSKDHWIYIALFMDCSLDDTHAGIKEFSKSGSRHDGYVQLKEAKYVLRMDLMSTVGNFSLLSSFVVAASFIDQSSASSNVLSSCSLPD